MSILLTPYVNFMRPAKEPGDAPCYAVVETIMYPRKCIR